MNQLKRASGAPLTSQTIAVLINDWRRHLAVYENPCDLVDLSDQVEFIRAAAAKAKLSRDTLNEIGAVLWDVVRKAGGISAQYERPWGGDANSELHRVTPKAKDLGYRSAQQRQRWETCAALPDVEVQHLRDRILGSTEGVLTQTALVAAGKHFLHLREAEERDDLTQDGCTVDDLQALIDAGRKFGVIYADPPWVFKVYSGKGKSRSAERHYKTDEETGQCTLSIEDLKKLPVAELAADDCALFLWAVMPELSGALEVLKAWGFTYKTVAFTWVKQNESGRGLHWGMGYWTRANAELCLLGTRGSPQRKAKDVHQIIMSPVGAHSRKPEEANARIERLVSGPYLEMFARRPMQGWTTWGNEITRGLFHQQIPEFVG